MPSQTAAPSPMIRAAAARRPIAALSGILLTATAAGQAIYPSTPDWESLQPHYSTGAAFADIDGDGRLDLVVADGNDIQPGRLNVYLNDGSGALPTSPSWQSGDLAYNGHLDVADVNGDGRPDVAVSYLGHSSSFAPIAKLYLNEGGTLSSLPAWSAHIDGNAFGVAFGDVNNDGRPDLAVGTGWAYSPPHHYPNYVYVNVGGALEPVASWSSSDEDHYQGVLWLDADGDGWLDLAGIGSDVETRVYRNLGGVLETTASWQTTDSAGQDGIMLAAGDVTGDGLLDLLATDNTQLGGSGLFKLYAGLPDGFFETNASWSYYEGYGSAVGLADVDGDGRLDLATGAWWDHARLFMNTGGGLPAAPTWSSGSTSVVEKIVFGDLDPPCGIEVVVRRRLAADGATRLFHLPDQPVQHVRAVRRDGVALGPGDFTWCRERGWLTVSGEPEEALLVEYTLGPTLDMAVSNWDSTIGNQLYYNRRIADCNGNGVDDGCDVHDGTSPDANDNGVPDECECVADVNGDGQVDVLDLLAVLAWWGPCPICPEDVDADGAVNVVDLLIVLGAWGTCD